MKVKEDGLTVAIEAEPAAPQMPHVDVFIPLPEEAEAGMKTDPYEHVTINGDTTLIRRGMHVSVPVPVFLQLRNKYPHI